jgi:hypothetical protein
MYWRWGRCGGLQRGEECRPRKRLGRARMAWRLIELQRGGFDTWRQRLLRERIVIQREAK